MDRLNVCFFLFLKLFIFQTNLTSLEGLNKYIDPSQLTTDLEGSLVYDHGIWIELRCVSILHSSNILQKYNSLESVYLFPTSG